MDVSCQDQVNKMIKDLVAKPQANSRTDIRLLMDNSHFFLSSYLDLLKDPSVHQFLVCLCSPVHLHPG